MLQFFNIRKSKQRDVRLRGHEKWVYGLRAHPNGEWVLSSGCDHTIRLFSSVTGECLRVFEGHQGRVWRVAFADQNTFLSASDDKTVRVWNISSNSPTNTVELGEIVWCVAKIGEGIFASGTISGKIHIHAREGDEITTRISFQAHYGTSLHGINCIASWRDRLGTASLDSTAKIWDIKTLKCLATLTGHEKSCRAISISESYIATASQDGVIILYDASNFEMIRRITTHGSYIRCVHVVGPEEHLLSSADDKTTRLHNSLTGDLMWTKPFAESAICSAVLKDGRLATGLASGDIVVYETPTDIVPHIKPLDTCRSIQCSSRTRSLHDALLSCVCGYSCPRDHCSSLIRYDTCRISYEEWLSAHRILMLAIEDGDVLKNTEFNNEQSWWYDNLYVAIRDIELTAHQYRQVKRCLTEAKENKLLECVDAVLAALHVTRDVRKNTRMIERAGTLILERILRMEDQLEQLRKAYSRYVTHQRKSQLVGIALQVIPIAGGVVAGAFSAGSEIVKGLSVKDVTDYAMGIGVNVAQSQFDEVGDRILGQAAESLSPASVQRMDLWHREKLEEALRFCGINIDTMHQLLLQRIKDKNVIALSNGQGTNKEEELRDSLDHEEDVDISASIVSTESSDEGGKAQEENLSTSGNESCGEAMEKASGTSEDCNPCPEVRKLGRPENQGQSISTDAPSSTGHFNDNPMSLAQLKLLDISARTIAELSQENIARLWAAYACRFNERENGSFCVLAEQLLSTLSDGDLYGSELVDRRILSVLEIMRLVEEGLENRHKKITHGQRARMKRFLLDVSSCTCLCEEPCQ